MDEPITEQWLREVGFKWDRPFGVEKHWTLWMGGAVSERPAYSSEDLGVELSAQADGSWFCWIRADYAGRYSRFVHVRYLRKQSELTALIAALTGFPFDAANCMYGSYHRPEVAARLREDYEKRLEVRMAKEWGERAMRETGQDADGREKVRP
jgi:hypothetical protein